MIANTINIKNGRQLAEAYAEYGVPIGKSVRELIEEILNNNIVPDTCVIIVNDKWFPITYQENPALLALRIKQNIDYLYLSAYRRDQFIIIHRGDSKISPTFFGQAVHSIREYDMWHALRGSIPLTYLTRPKQFTNLLVRHFGCGFATIAKRKSITWSRRKEDLDKYGFIC